MAGNGLANGVDRVDRIDRASQLLESLNLPASPSFASFLEHLYQQRYSGPVTFHFENGQPRVIELTKAVRVPLERPPK